MLTSHAAEIKWSYKVQPVRWVQHPSLPTIQLGRPYSGTAPVDCIQIWIKPWKQSEGDGFTQNDKQLHVDLDKKKKPQNQFCLDMF